MTSRFMKYAAVAFLVLSVFVDFSSHIMSVLSDGLLIGAALLFLHKAETAS